MDPAVREHGRVGKAEAATELRAKAAEHVRGGFRLVGDDQDQVAGVGATRLDEPALDVVRQELRDRPVELAVVLDREVDEALRPEPLRELGQLVGLAAGRAAQARRHDRLDPAAAGQRLVEDPEAAAADQHRGQVDQLHPEPEVRLVAAEALHRLVVGEARERDLLDRAFRRRRPRDLDDHLLDEAHHRVLVDEAHLEVELGELRLAIAAEVLVAEAAGDLEVAIDARDHQELLELLGALRQGVDAARAGAATGR